ncbi:solute carrier family 41 member 3 isoform X1 [Physeter macrocephalus]|uniref:Solute carrier family 41 member n=1 Tax=Physeter macrocephalus TaxID=9755 RepID=A0A455AF10_PHYMC|nr:solute carrier family 41 member 3 isoform X1 [Physeter catodon]XP_028334818.1 solute carrier family 41 member 3 isoform X1 [Physeter catodon]|eukprot:XP_028334817.1 solute carrier family 41 member 3 isoform X1 [Physeter catodon]
MLMVCIVIGARKLGVNPDNIATPIAASLGDLITLSLLAFVSSFFHKHRDSRYLTPLVCIGFTALTAACILIAKQNPPVVKILKVGWFPIVLAMLVSSIGGLILNKTISKQQFQGMAVFAPIICGVGGNLVAIQTSRISTYLHLWSTPGILPLGMKERWPNPRSTFCSSAPEGMTGLVPVAGHAAHAAAPDQLHVGPRPALPGGSGPPHLLLHHLPGGRPVSPKRQNLRGALPAGGPGPGNDGPWVPSWERSLDTQDTVPTFEKSSQSIQPQGRDPDTLLRARVDFSQAVFQDSSWEGRGLCRVMVGSGGHSHEGGVSMSVTLKDRLGSLGNCPEQLQGSGCGAPGPDQGLRCLHEGPAGRSCPGWASGKSELHQPDPCPSLRAGGGAGRPPSCASHPRGAQGGPGVAVSTVVSALDMCWFLGDMGFLLGHHLVSAHLVTGDDPAVPGGSDGSADVEPGPGPG